MKPRRNFSQSALTLMELLCVIAIISILAALSLAAIAPAIGKAKKLNKDVSEGNTNIINYINRADP
jgi:prepilin-type N-terminal cleavage/methylation domain-containing protein